MLFRPDGLVSPLTTKGDVFVYGASANQRLPVGADNLFLKSDSSVTLGMSWSSTSGAAVGITAITSSVTLGSSCDYIFVSGGTFTITLPNAASFLIKPITITRTDQNLSLGIYFDGLIGGSTNWVFWTLNEKLTIIPDGTNWQIVDRYAKTTWNLQSGITILATSVHPTKGSSRQTDNLWWRRDGDSVELRYEYRQDSNTGAASGTGDYLFLLPEGLNIDSNKLTLYSVVAGNYLRPNNVGSAQVSGAGSTYPGVVDAYSGGALRITFTNASTTSVVTSVNAQLLAASLTYAAHCVLPISGWKP